MNTYNYLDKQGLQTLVSKIDENYVSKKGYVGQLKYNPDNIDTQKLEYVNKAGTYVSTYNELKAILQNPLSNVTILYNDGIVLYPQRIEKGDMINEIIFTGKQYNYTTDSWEIIMLSLSSDDSYTINFYPEHIDIFCDGQSIEYNGVEYSYSDLCNLIWSNPVSKFVMDYKDLTLSYNGFISFETTYLKDDAPWYVNIKVKDTGIEIIDIPIGSQINITYAELVALRNSSKLVPGMFYRITDYVTTSIQAETQSAGHVFDVIVKALSENVLSEEANAIQHNGDAYFDGCKLELWELKYCLDNDTTRFMWADEVNGKGVIYYMKDEFNNECPYDFKNIQFKLYAGTGSGWTSYLSNTGASATTIVPYRLTLAFNSAKVGKYTWNINANDYTYAYTYSGYNDDKTTFDKSLNGEVHDCHIGNNWATVQKDDSKTYKVLSLNFIVAIPFLLSQKNNTFNVYSNNFGINCHDIVFSNNCYSNKLGDKCYNIHTPRGCSSWLCGNNCHSWTCGSNCTHWTCGNNCYRWTCGSNCTHWTCGRNCYSWSCGSSCYDWSCGSSCYDWSCGSSCYSWSCGNSCYSWTCGRNCYSWSCGSSCSSWTCGNYCSYWSCGNDCSSWIIGTKSNTQRDYASYFHLGNGVGYLYIYSTSTPTLNTPLKNFVIKSGVKGINNNNRLEIIIDNNKFPLNTDYEWIIGRNSNGEIVQYCAEDLLNQNIPPYVPPCDNDILADGDCCDDILNDGGGSCGDDGGSCGGDSGI